MPVFCFNILKTLKHLKKILNLSTDKPEGTRLTSDAQNDAVTENFEVTFHCTANSVPPPELQLLFNNSSLGFFINNKFVLTNVNSSNQGTYKCIPRNILGTGPAASLNLTVLGKCGTNFIGI